MTTQMREEALVPVPHEAGLTRRASGGGAPKLDARHQFWPRLIKRALLVLLLAGLVAAIVLAWLPDPIPVDVASVRRAALLVTVDEDGRTRVKDRYIVSAPLLASVARIELEPGDAVRQGQPLAHLLALDPPLLDARTRAQTEARVAAAVAGRRQSESGVQRARTALEFARGDSERQRELMRKGATAERAVESAELQERTLREELASAEFAARVASYELEMTKLALARQTSRGQNNDVIDIVSALDGQVLKLLQESAGVVQPGTPLLELGNVNALEIVADVLTSDAVHIRKGARVWVERWGGEQALRAHVRKIEPSAFTRLSALGVEEQRVNVIVDLDEPRDRWAALGDGYRVEVRIATWEGENVLSIPASSLFRRAERWVTFTVRDGRAHLVPLEVGQRNGEQVEVRSGVEQGARIIVHPSDQVIDGARVQPRAAP